MKILAHRGYWNERLKRNSSEAILESLVKGYGFESDIRDYCGKIVISHDIATSYNQPAEEVFQWLAEYGDNYCFAINIKADGLIPALKQCLDRYKVRNYFAFDMSVPQMLEYKEAGIRFFTRQSEIEEVPCLYESAVGVWIDGFWTTDWITKELIEKHINSGKEVCVVSPELHGREIDTFWRYIKSWGDLDNLYLCTDYPDKAKEFFYGEEY